MEISLENLIALDKNETVTITIEDCKGEFTVSQTPEKFVIFAPDLKLETSRESGLLCALYAWQAVSDIVGDWPEV